MRILAGVWCLMSIVIVYSYTGKLTSYLTVPKLRPIPNSFEELAQNENYKLAVQANTVLAQSILVRYHAFVAIFDINAVKWNDWKSTFRMLNRVLSVYWET